MLGSVGRQFIRRCALSTLPQNALVSGTVQLPRALLSVYGKESTKFLNGLLPITPPRLDSGTRTRYTALLNAAGRITADAFVTNVSSDANVQRGIGIEDEVCYVLEVDTAVLDTVMSTFELHALTADVNVKSLPGYSVYSVWNDELEPGIQPSPLSVNAFLTAPDPRVEGFGYRVITASSGEWNKGGVDPKIVDYRLRRYLFGLAEGVDELRVNKSLPLEYCFDYQSGIDFDKGCYLGQELVCRMHQQNMVKKRLLPVVISDPAARPANEEGDIYRPETFDLSKFADIFDDNPTPHVEMLSSLFPKNAFDAKPARRPCGKLVSAVGNIGIAVLRMDYADHTFTVDGLTLTPMRPFWWPLDDAVSNASAA